MTNKSLRQGLHDLGYDLEEAYFYQENQRVLSEFRKSLSGKESFKDKSASEARKVEPTANILKFPQTEASPSEKRGLRKAA